MFGIHMSHFRGKSAGQSLKWGITIIYDLSVLIYQRDFYRTAVNFLSRGACKAIKSVFIDPSHVYRTAIKNKVKNWRVFQDDASNGEDVAPL